MPPHYPVLSLRRQSGPTALASFDVAPWRFFKVSAMSIRAIRNSERRAGRVLAGTTVVMFLLMLIAAALS
jgi:hypothetical protein